MDFNYTKIKIGNWLFKNCFPLYNLTYSRFKTKNDAQELSLLKTLIKPGFQVLDIGANIGFYAKNLSKMVGPTGRVYCFEPDSTNFKHLQKNTKALSNVTLFNQAVSDKKEVLKVYKSKLLNVDHRTYPVSNYDSIEEIQAVSIDDLINNKTLPVIDLIKIDIQGFELSAFKGMINLLKSHPYLKIVGEFWPHGFNRAGVSAIEFFDFFQGLGYTFYIISAGALEPLKRDYVVQHNKAPFEFSFNILIEKQSLS